MRLNFLVEAELFCACLLVSALHHVLFGDEEVRLIALVFFEPQTCKLQDLRVELGLVPLSPILYVLSPFFVHDLGFPSVVSRVKPDVF